MEGYPGVVQRLLEHRDEWVVTCVIVHGELVFMAQNSQRRNENLRRIRAFLRGIEVLPVDQETANHYGDLKATLIRRLGPREKAQKRKTGIRELGFEENDLWIAAIAIRHGLTLVSSDSDFTRVAKVVDLPIEKWWSPEFE